MQVATHLRLYGAVSPRNHAERQSRLPDRAESGAPEKNVASANRVVFWRVAQAILAFGLI